MNSTEYTLIQKSADISQVSSVTYIFLEFVYAFESMFTFYMYMDAYGLWFNYVMESNIGANEGHGTMSLSPTQFCNVFFFYLQ